jgi:signal transduction histidine kinase
MLAQEARPAVWLLDDSKLEGEMSRRVLACNFDVRTFTDPAVMLEQLAASTRPALLVIDWHMPEMSGLDVCKYVRTIANSAELPILILTATGSSDDLVAGLQAGANDFVTKPCRDAELTARVASLTVASSLHHKLSLAETGLRDEAEFREKFIAILAHDLRQPLNVFAMGASLLADGAPAGGVSRRFVTAAGRMNRMLDDLLDFSRSRQRNGIPIERASSDVAAVANEVVEEVRHANPGREITLVTNGDCRGEWDADRVAQVFSNLLGNALEHSTSDFPIHVTVRGDGDGVELIVENACPRIADEVVLTIFDPFRQGKPSRTGLGLGLYIVRAIVRAHGGDVFVDSNDQRTRFVARLLRGGAPAQPPAQMTPRPFPRK